MMKRILIVLLIAVLILGIVSCGKAKEKAAENMIESIIEEQAGGEVDVDVNDGGDSITISSDDGEFSIQGDESGIPWPSDKLPANVPELKGVKVVSVIDVGTGVSIAFQNCSTSITEDYISQIKASGWEIVMNVDSEGYHMITATNSQNEVLNFTLEEENGGGTIIYGQE